jgi:hypothetical protein
MVWWPVGLAILAYILWSGRMGCGHHDRWHRWQQRGMRGFCGFAERWHGDDRAAAAPTGNETFDSYRDETLRRLEEDQREFLEYLDRLRRAKDRAEFEQFMAERSRRRDEPRPPPDAGGRL